MKNITIRKVSAHDSVSIAKVQVETWKTTYNGIISSDYLDSLEIEAKSAGWKKRIKSNSVFILVAEADGEVVGFITGGESQEKLEYDGEIQAFYVLESYQGYGIGKKLFQLALQELTMRECESCYLWVLKNGPAQSWYEYMGGNYIDEKNTTA